MTADLHEQLLAALDGHDPCGALPAALRAVVELHAAREGRCHTCVESCDCLDDVAGGDVEAAGNAALRCMHGNVPAPCSTIQAIADQLGITPGGDPC